MHVMAVTDREFAAIIAGLRLLQRLPQLALPQPLPAEVLEIATGGGKLGALTHEEIDRLIEKETAPVPAPRS